MKILKGFSVFAVAAFMILTAAAGSGSTVGIVDFPVSCNEAVQKDFNHALAMTHHMMYLQAGAEFESIAKKEPTCAMAHWGLAMTLFHPLWAPPSQDELTRGIEALDRAMDLKPSTERERDHILAARAFYEDWETVDHRDRVTAWKEAIEEVYESWPDDLDASAFYALSVLAAAPKGDTTFTEQKKAGKILEDLHARASEHPAGYHYLIHAYDNPLLAEKAVGIARGYDRLAPDVPHALHMPTHIFVRLGLWADVVNWNERSAAAALKAPAGGTTSLHYAHAMDYLVYANLQIGEDDKALTALKTMNGIESYQDSFASAYALAAAGGRYLLERSKWDEAARFDLAAVPDFPWEKYSQYEAISWFTRGVGAARSGDLETANEALERLGSLHAKIVDADQQYWATLVKSQSQTVEAWMAYSRGDGDALTRMRAAADLEDSVDKHPVTPGAVLPARELLGDMLLLQKKYPDAIKAYESSLEISANRLRSLYGLARAAELGGQDDLAREYYRKLVDVTRGHPADRPEVRHAKSYLGSV